MAKTVRTNGRRFGLQKQSITNLHDPSVNPRWFSDAIEKGFPGQPLLIRAGQ
jgi:hypothetical protein